MNNILTAKVGNKWLFIPLGTILGLFILTTGCLWLFGMTGPIPRFTLDPGNPGRIKPIDWSWWHAYAEMLNGHKYVMLTFDDGPAEDASINASILETLEKHHAHATFFSVCRNALKPGGAEALKANVTAGHVIGNHSFSHLPFPKLPPEATEHEVLDCAKILSGITGKEIRWFRPPWGQTSAALTATLEHNHMKNVLWSSNSGDTWLHNPEQINALTEVEVEDGAILLMHSNAVEAQALDKSLSLLESHGYRFVVPEE